MENEIRILGDKKNKGLYKAAKQRSVDLSRKVELEEKRKLAQPQKQSEAHFQGKERLDLREYIAMPGIQYEGYTRPDILICKHRLRAEDTQYPLIRTGNSGKDIGRKPYLGNMERHEALEHNRYLGGHTLTLKEFMSFLALLRRGKEFKSTEVFNGEKEQIGQEELDIIFRDITEQNDGLPRGEFLNTRFERHKFDGEISTKFCAVSEVNKGIFREELVPYLTKGGHYNLPSILEGHTIQGLPHPDLIVPGDLRYEPPSTGRNAVFAVAACAHLQCDAGNEVNHYIGIRHAIILNKERTELEEKVEEKPKQSPVHDSPGHFRSRSW
ncbi:hypothetical protein ACFLZZ_04000 [Nanoarchaeota archaeon]